MRGRGFILPFMLLLLIAAQSPSGRVFEPEKDSADQASVLAVHKNRARADMNIEPYEIVLILMAHTGKGQRALSLAYVDARASDDLVVFQQVLMRRRGGTWQEIWSDGANGANECAQGIVHYQKIIRFVQKNGVDPAKLLPGFQEKVINAKKGIECEFGDFDADDKVLK
jgi:hypothetical protein